MGLQEGDDRMSSLWRSGLTLLNISLDTLREDRFESMTRRRGLSRVLDTIHQAVDMGFDPVKVTCADNRNELCIVHKVALLSAWVHRLKCTATESVVCKCVRTKPVPISCRGTVAVPPLQVNVVVMRGQNDDEVLDFVEMTRSVPINIRFIEYMPFDGNVWSNEKMVPFAKLAERINGQYSPGLERLQVH